MYRKFFIIDRNTFDPLVIYFYRMVADDFA